MRCSQSPSFTYKVLSAVLAAAVTISVSLAPIASAASGPSSSQAAETKVQTPSAALSSSRLDAELAKYLGPQPSTVTDYLNLNSDAEKSFEYGLDSDGVAFARHIDGTKGRYVTPSRDHFKLEISNRRQLGALEFQRYPSGRTSMRFEAPRGGTFFLRTKPDPNSKDPNKFRVELQYGKDRVELKIDAGSSSEAPPMPAANAAKLEKIGAALRRDLPLMRLIETSSKFTDKAVATRALLAVGMSAPNFNPCAISILECYAAIVAYVASIVTLILLCPETIGITCFLAILAHPALGPLAVLKCANVFELCGIPKPPPPEKRRFQEICFEVGGFWSDYYIDCVPSVPTSEGMCDTFGYWWNPFNDLCQLDPPPECNLVPAYCNYTAWSDLWCGCLPELSPILIDVAGDGFKLSNRASGVDFNLNNIGGKERIGWLRPNNDDAWLVLDRNHNGSIDNGEELFGNVTMQPEPPPGESKNGFLALALYDQAANGGNGDGVIDSSDAIYSSLRLWRDTNHDGVSQADELFTLPALDVASIELAYKLSKKTDEFGNQFRYRAKVTGSKGNKVGRWAWDVFLAR